MPNEISDRGKTLAGFLLIVTIAFSLLGIIALWPDVIPTAHDRIKPVYHWKLFAVTLAMIPDSITDTGAGMDQSSGILPAKPPVTDSSSKTTPPTKIRSTTTFVLKKDSARMADSLKATAAKARTGNTASSNASQPAAALPTEKPRTPPASSSSYGRTAPGPLIHLNTLIFVLVVLGGLLGNLIYISASITNYVGADQYKNSWTLWYVIKPFTAAGLALAIYFVFRGGFLSATNDPIAINLFGTMTISILAGLFTDRTTLKLKEVFDVLLKPNDKRPDGDDQATAAKPVPPAPPAQTSSASPLPVKATDAITENDIVNDTKTVSANHIPTIKG